VLFPGAVAAFATQCDDIPASRFVFDQWDSKNGKLRLSVPLRLGRYGCTTWMPEMKLWRRYSKSFRNRPTYLDNEGTRCSVCGHLTLCRHAVVGAPHPHG
jgi:hypothetical protein